MMIFQKLLLRTLLNDGGRLCNRPWECGLGLYSTSPRLGTTQQQSPLVRLPPGFNGPTPFALFVKEQMKGQAGQKASDAMKAISANWKQISEGDKQQYMESSKKLKAQLKEDFQKLPEEQKSDLLLKRVEKLEKRRRIRKKRQLHKFNAQTNRPKQPMTSYMLFIKDRIDKRATTFSSKEETMKFATETGEKWRTMSADEKQPFIEQAKSNLQQYHRELDEWKSRNAKEIEEWKEEHTPKKKKKATVKKVRKLKAKKGPAKPKKAVGKAKPAKAAKSKEVDEKKKKPTTAAKKVKKSEVKGAVD